MENSIHGAGGLERAAEDVCGKYSDVEDYLNEVSEEEFTKLMVAHAKTVFAYMQEQRKFSSLPLLERMKRRLDQFKERSIKRGGALAGFNVAYGAGGRSMFRDAVNSLFHFISVNFQTMNSLFAKMMTDVIRGKRFVEVISDFNIFVRNVVQQFRKDPENLRLLRYGVGELRAAAENIGGLLNDALEFPGVVSVYDDAGKLRPLEDIDTEFVTSRCNRVRLLIKKSLAANRRKYEEAATELLRTGLTMEAVLVALEEKMPLPVSILTEKSLKDELNTDNYAALCDLYNSLQHA